MRPRRPPDPASACTKSRTGELSQSGAPAGLATRLPLPPTEGGGGAAGAARDGPPTQGGVYARWEQGQLALTAVPSARDGEDSTRTPRNSLAK